MDNLKDKVINNRYRIEDVVGIGGMAVVYRAIDLNTNTRVAVKVLKDEYLENQASRTRFEAESKIIAMLSHENIVKVYDVGFNDDLYYIVMEYVDGIPLKKYIDQEGSLNLNEATHFMIQILKALSHAHSRGVVHRDIKPQNIMLLENGSIKVMDFGIAKYAQSVTVTMADHAIGSVHYISPEQVRGKKTDTRSDIYSTGIMFYEMLTGKVPFDAEAPISVAMKQLNELPVAPIEIRNDIPPAMNEIILKAISKEPSARYSSAQAFLDDLLKAKQNNNLIFGYQVAFKQKDTVSADDRPTAQLDTIPTTGTHYIPSKRRRRKLIIGISSAVLVAVSVFLIWIGLKTDVKVPSFIGENPADLDKYSYLSIVIQGERYDDTVEKGLICAQTPEAGISVKRGSKAELWVSKGVELVPVPQLNQLSLALAVNQLNNCGLKYESVSEFSSTVPSGYVIRTEPAFGNEVPKGSVIRVIVSKGENITSQTAPIVTNEKTLIVPLSGFENECSVSVFQDGSLIYQNEHQKESAIAISVFGNGISQFEICVNGRSFQTYAVDFE